jgi:hypothetical protein
MKAKVIIENGETSIFLTPENEFEVDIIEKLYCKKENHNLHTSANANYNFGVYSKHNIEISIKEIK